MSYKTSKSVGLNHTMLEKDLLQAFRNSQNNKTAGALPQLCTELATIITNYVKSAQVTSEVTTTVATPNSYTGHGKGVGISTTIE